MKTNFRQVVCDGCGATVPPHPGAESKKEAKAFARERGWALAGGGRGDLCALCVAVTAIDLRTHQEVADWLARTTDHDGPVSRSSVSSLIHRLASKPGTSTCADGVLAYASPRVDDKVTITLLLPDGRSRPAVYITEVQLGDDGTA